MPQQLSILPPALRNLWNEMPSLPKPFALNKLMDIFDRLPAVFSKTWSSQKIQISEENGVVTLTNGKTKFQFVRPTEDQKVTRVCQEIEGLIRTKIFRFKNLEEINFIYQECEKNGFALGFYFDVINHPKSYLSNDGDHISFSPLPFKECKCEAFSHLKVERREKLEAAIVDHISKNVSKSERVNLLSMGCGNLLEEWFVIGKLIQKGYYNFDLVLVDPKADEKLVLQFQKFFEKFPKVNLRCTAKKSIQQVDKNFRADAIFAIDFDVVHSTTDATADLLKCFPLLSDQGRLFFGAGDTSCIISNSKLESFIEVSKEIQVIKTDIKKVLLDNPDKAKVQIVVESELWDDLIYLLHDMTEEERKRLEIFYVTKFNDDHLRMIHHCLNLPKGSIIDLRDLRDERPEQPSFVLTTDITFSEWEKAIENKTDRPLLGKTTSVYIIPSAEFDLRIGTRSKLHS